MVTVLCKSCVELYGLHIEMEYHRAKHVESADGLQKKVRPRVLTPTKSKIRILRSVRRVLFFRYHMRCFHTVLCAFSELWLLLNETIVTFTFAVSSNVYREITWSLSDESSSKDLFTTYLHKCCVEFTSVRLALFFSAQKCVDLSFISTNCNPETKLIRRTLLQPQAKMQPPTVQVRRRPSTRKPNSVRLRRSCVHNEL